MLTVQGRSHCQGDRNIQKQKSGDSPHSFALFLAMSQNTMTHEPHILLVEDDREIRSLVSRFLQRNEVRVSAVGDGRAMDRLLKDNRIDLIVLDLMLPGENGLEICRRLRLSSNLPVIMLTAKGEDVDRIVGL